MAGFVTMPSEKKIKIGTLIQNIEISMLNL